MTKPKILLRHTMSCRKRRVKKKLKVIQFHCLIESQGDQIKRKIQNVKIFTHSKAVIMSIILRGFNGRGYFKTVLISFQRSTPYTNMRKSKLTQQKYMEYLFTT